MDIEVYSGPAYSRGLCTGNGFCVYQHSYSRQTGNRASMQSLASVNQQKARKKINRKQVE